MVLDDSGFVEKINITVVDDFSVDHVWAQIEFPDHTKQNYSMSNLAGNIYNLTFTQTTQRGEYTIIFYANDSFDNIGDTENNPFNFYVPA